MAENKTKPTAVSVEEYISALPDERKRADAHALVALMSELTGEPATLWGPSIIGFGSYHYRYESGREGDSPLLAFSPRKAAISLYLSSEFAGRDDLLAKFGKHTTGQACIYVKKLDDVDRDVLREMCARSFEHSRATHGGT